jgi:hypothetical protein
MSMDTSAGLSLHLGPICKPDEPSDWSSPSTFSPNFHWLGKTGLKVLGLLQSKGSCGLQMGPSWKEDRGLCPWAFWWRRLCSSLGRYDTFFQVEVYASLACVHEIKSQAISEKHVSICSDCQAALKALQAIRTSFLFHECQKALNEICVKGCGAVLGLWTCWVRSNEIAVGLARCSSGSSFVGSEPAFGD